MKSSINLRVLLWNRVRLSIFIYVTGICIAVACNQSNNDSISSKKETQEPKDRTVTTVRDVLYAVDYYNISERTEPKYITNYSYMDKYGVWFTKEIYGQMRIVYQLSNKTLLIYSGENLFAKYENIIGKEKFEKTYTDNIFNEKTTSNIYLFNEGDTIVHIHENSSFQIKSITYYPNKREKYQFLTYYSSLHDVVVGR